MSRQPAVARWYQAAFEHVPPATDHTRYLAVVFVMGQLAEYWTGALEVPVEEICTRAGIGRGSAYEILRELQNHGLLVTRGRVAKGGPIRRLLAIGGQPPSVQTRVEQPSLTGDDRIASPAVRTAAEQPQLGIAASVSTGSSRGDAVRRRRDPDACPTCQHLPCLPDCSAADFRRTGVGPAGPPVGPAAAEAIRSARKLLGGGR